MIKYAVYLTTNVRDVELDGAWFGIYEWQSLVRRWPLSVYGNNMIVVFIKKR